jgi:hypothetical protein
MNTPSQPNPARRPGATPHHQSPPGSFPSPGAPPSGSPPAGPAWVPPGYVPAFVPVVLVAQPQTNTRALISLILGICSYVVGTGALTGIPAIVLGHQAIREIDGSAGAQSGRSLAVTGLVLGYVAVGLTVAGCLFLAIFVFGIVGAISGAISTFGR